MFEVVTIGKGFTLIIPKYARRQLQLKEGQYLQARVDSGCIILEPYPLDSFEALKTVIREPYNEDLDEKNADAWLKKQLKLDDK